MNEELVISVGEFLGRIEKDSPNLITRSDFLKVIFDRVAYFRKCCKCEREKVMGEINEMMGVLPNRLPDDLRTDIKQFLGANLITLKNGENQIAQF